ncbi:MAG: carboxypeptidase regulatory-like domain-containing protein [Thermoplasmatota archaeon]
MQKKERSLSKTATLLFFSLLLIVHIPWTSGDPFPPILSPPRDPIAVPGNGFVQLSWTEPEFGALTVTGYNIFRGESPGEEIFLSMVDGDVLNYRDPSVQNDVRYYYYMTAISEIYTSDPSDPVSAQPDGTAPLLEIISPINNSVSTTGSFEIRWAGEDRGTGISHYKIKKGTEPWKDVGMNTIHLLTDLLEDEHLIQVSAVDRAGNDAVRSVVLFVDMTPPRVKILKPGDGAIIKSENLDLRWTGDDYESGMDGFRIMINDYYIGYEGMDDNYTIKGIKEGMYSIVVEGFDRGGNVGSDRINISIDTSAPWLVINSPVNETWTNNSEVQIIWSGGDTGSGIEKYMIREDEGPWVSTGLETDRILELSDEGEHSIKVKAIDRSGREIVRNLTVLIDTSDPRISITEPVLGGHLNTSDIRISWTGNDDHSGIDSYMIKLDGGSFTRLNMETEHSYSYLTNGPHKAVLRTRDRAGNILDTEIPFNIDTMSPEVLAKGPAGSYIEEPWEVWAEFNEEMSPGSVEIELSNRTGFTRYVAGRYIFTPDIPLDYGEVYAARVNGLDLAGNPLDEVSWTFRVTDQGTVTGRIFDEEGFPVAGALVILDSGKTTSTDQDGRFNLTDRMGERTITILEDGYVTKTIVIDLTPETEAKAGNIYLERAKENSSSWSAPAFLLDAWTYVVLLLVIVALALTGYLMKDRLRSLMGRYWNREDDEFEVRVRR